MSGLGGYRQTYTSSAFQTSDIVDLVGVAVLPITGVPGHIHVDQPTDTKGPVIDLVPTGVEAKTYAVPVDVIIDEFGRVVSATEGSGSVGTGTVTSVTAGAGLSGGTITST